MAKATSAGGAAPPCPHHPMLPWSWGSAPHISQGCLPSSSFPCPAFPVLHPLCPLRLPGGMRALLLQRSCRHPLFCCHTGHKICQASAPGWGQDVACKRLGLMRKAGVCPCTRGTASSWMGVQSPGGVPRHPQSWCCFPTQCQDAVPAHGVTRLTDSCPHALLPMGDLRPLVSPKDPGH